MTKRCIDCKHYVAGNVTPYMYFPSACTHENNRSLVDGSCRDGPEELRYSHHSKACGEIGRWWEQNKHSAAPGGKSE
jgi:hypothetical protein